MPDTVVVRHEQNEHFSWQPHTGPFGFVTADQARMYDDLGYFVLEDAFDPAVVEEMVTEIDPFEAQVEEALRSFDKGTAFIARADEITFTTHLVTRSARLRAIVAADPLLGLCRDLIGPDVRLYWDQAVYKKPDTDASFPWHQDNGYAFVEPQQYLTCWIALTDATRDNGCPWVVPGLHRLGTLAHHLTDTGYVCLDNPPDAVPVPVQAGSVVVFSSLTPHCTGPNRTDEVRKAYIVQYAPDGAEVQVRDADGEVQRYPADDARRQFPVLREGQAVTRDAGSYVPRHAAQP
jgi:ectoine hydroxylase-related dioxygenase (phytanoyl-CoA dioxygenase family)